MSQTEEQIHILFEEFGTIKRINFPKSRKDKSYLGYCFISYYEHSHAKKAVSVMDKTKHDYCILNVIMAK